MPDSKEVFESFKHLVPGTYVSLVTKNHTDMELFGKTLFMGNEQITLRDPAVPVLDYESLRMQLLPSDDILIYHYKKFGLSELQGAQSVWPAVEDDELED